ncbi:hypothetical protein BDV95DRAFT_2977 [Massariosphaeria phaeospora]|uniref:Uncharacterized protein n=1 Tax=Massariosphaeria phaeospora TaxID=100035 RepID=A0A7C8IF37_9PLEO|nr:hypothetical protein BDV95DRAFT_2977 [Massariosphaeria phaeospora]
MSTSLEPPLLLASWSWPVRGSHSAVGLAADSRARTRMASLCQQPDRTPTPRAHRQTLQASKPSRTESILQPAVPSLSRSSDGCLQALHATLGRHAPASDPHHSLSSWSFLSSPSNATTNATRAPLCTTKLKCFMPLCYQHFPHLGGRLRAHVAPDVGFDEHGTAMTTSSHRDSDRSSGHRMLPALRDVCASSPSTPRANRFTESHHTLLT